MQGDPQHRNALHYGDRTVLCDWDTVAWGPPEWDLVTIEIHCRRFGHGKEHYKAFADAYGFDVTTWPGYRVLRDIRELRMVTTNAKKTAHTPGSLAEVERRITGFQAEDAYIRWNICEFWASRGPLTSGTQRALEHREGLRDGLPSRHGVFPQVTALP